MIQAKSDRARVGWPGWNLLWGSRDERRGRVHEGEPGPRHVITASKRFAHVRDAAGLDVDGERLYIVRGDTFGDEADLYLETLVRVLYNHRPDDPN